MITSSTFSSVILRGCPGRGSSNNPSTPNSTNRRRHKLLHVAVHAHPLRDLGVALPSAAASTIRARHDSAAATVRRRVHLSNTPAPPGRGRSPQQ
jgi:hypothetical protein